MVFHKDNSGNSDNNSEHATQHGFEEKKPYTAKDISEFIGKHANVATKTVWKAIEKTAEALGVKVNFISDAEYFKIHPKNSNGVYKNGEITIRSGIFGNPARAAYVMTHEAIHGVTSHIINAVKKGDKTALAKLSEKQIKAAQTLSKLLEYSKAKGHLKGEYGITNEHELLAELSNPDFVKKLQGANKGVVDRIVNWVMDMIGIPQTDYDKARKVLKDMLTAPKQVESNSKGVSLKETTIAKQQKDLGVQYSMLTKSDFNADGTVKESVLKEIEAERKTIIEQAKTNGTYMQAPNGKPTKLNKEQWVATRTKRFKDWFGDWENDPENASKVKDENGEPLVVYHGTNYAGFSEFRESSRNIYFSNIDRASWYVTTEMRPKIAKEFNDNGYYGGIYAVFLNIRKPKNIDAKGKHAQKINDTIPKNKDGVIVDNALDPTYDDGSWFEATNYIVSNPTQIKSATDNVGTFSSDNNNILFQKGNKSEQTTAPLTEKEKTSFIGRLFGKGLAKSITVDEAKMRADMEQRFGEGVTLDEASAGNNDVQFLRTSQGEVKGYVTPDGHVFIDPKHLDSNTPVHEFGHLWNSHIKENNPELWAKGRELVKNSPEWDRIKNSKEYAHLQGDENKIADEVLATLYGEEGQKRLAGKDKGLLQNIKDWVAEVWNDLKQVFGKGNPDILKMTPEQISNLSLGEFIGKAVDNITDGKRLESSGKQEADSDFFAEDDARYQIDSDQDNEESDTDTRRMGKKAVETRAFLSNNLDNDVRQMLEDNGLKYKQQNQNQAEVSVLYFLLLVGVSTNRKEKNSWSLKTQPFSKNINTIETFSIKNKDFFVPLYCSPFLK